jgi:hypothetical protein
MKLGLISSASKGPSMVILGKIFVLFMWSGARRANNRRLPHIAYVHSMCSNVPQGSHSKHSEPYEARQHTLWAECGVIYVEEVRRNRNGGV